MSVWVSDECSQDADEHFRALALALQGWYFRNFPQSEDPFLKPSVTRARLRKHVVRSQREPRRVKTGS